MLIKKEGKKLFGLREWVIKIGIGNDDEVGSRGELKRTKKSGWRLVFIVKRGEEKRKGHKYKVVKVCEVPEYDTTLPFSLSSHFQNLSFLLTIILLFLDHYATP